MEKCSDHIEKLDTKTRTSFTKTDFFSKKWGKNGENVCFSLHTLGNKCKRNKYVFFVPGNKKWKGEDACMGCTKRTCPVCANLRNRGDFCENKPNNSREYFFLISFFTYYYVEMTLIFAYGFIRIKTQSIRRRYFTWRKRPKRDGKTFLGGSI